MSPKIEENPSTPNGALSEAVLQFQDVHATFNALNSILLDEDDTMRPSSAFRAICEVIDVQFNLGAKQFINHEASWREAQRILLREADIVEPEIDAKYAMLVPYYSWEADDLFTLMGRMTSQFNSRFKYLAYNRFSDSWGSLTPAECLELVYFMLRFMSPPSEWESGFWKEKGPDNRWVQWPWVAYVMERVNSLYTAMKPSPGGFNIPPGYGGGFSWG
jgi:hypothetical protein